MPTLKTKQLRMNKFQTSQSENVERNFALRKVSRSAIDIELEPMLSFSRQKLRCVQKLFHTAKLFIFLLKKCHFETNSHFFQNK